MCRMSATCSIGIETPNSASISETTLIWASESHACRSSGPVSSVSVDFGTRNAAATIAISLSPMVSLSRFDGLWSKVQKYGFRIEAINILCGEPLRAERRLPFPAGSHKRVPRHRPMQHSVIDDHRHDFERRGNAHHQLSQVSREDIGCADMVDPRERKPQVPANRLRGTVHHHVAVAHRRPQQNVMIKRQLVIPKEPQALALESALDGARIDEDLATIHEGLSSDDGEDDPFGLVHQREVQLLHELKHLRGRAEVRDGHALVSDDLRVQR